MVTNSIKTLKMVHIKKIFLKKFSVFLLYSQIYVTITTVHFRTFSSPQKEIRYPLVITLSSPHCFPPGLGNY